MPARSKLCSICGKPRQSYYRQCPRCKGLIGINKRTRDRAAALKAAYDKATDSFYCYYTGIKVDLTDTSSPWFITFDHFFPRKNGNLKVCAAFVNNMKSNLSGDEFWQIVMEYARHRKGAPFNPNIVGFNYWNRKAKTEPQTARFGRAAKLVKVDNCVICGHPPAKFSYYCPGCLQKKPNALGRAKAMRRSWSKARDAFLDYYIGVKLEEKDLDDPYYRVFDHRIPRKKGDLALTSMLMNAMKGDLSVREFNLVMNELARHFDGKAFNKEVIKFKYWRRPKYLVDRK